VTNRIAALWEEAAIMDATLELRKKDLAALREKRIRAEKYGRARLFSRMVKGQASLLKDFPVSLKSLPAPDPRAALSQLIRKGFPSSQKARVQAGRSRTQCNLKISEVMGRWEGSRAILGVTDLHFRGTKFADTINFSALSDFDILCSDPEFIYLIEMMTLVISSRGNVTDSHQDDCDGSNHCFVGKKLWLAWDRLQGKARGFQDVDRDHLTEPAVFDMPTFLSLPSACWFVIKANETLFLPGSLAHKVITLEPYIGIGGFHVTLPGYLRSLKRWILYDTLDIKQENLLDKINTALIKRIHQVQKGARGLREHWGLSYIQKAIDDWETNENPKTKRILFRHPTFATFIESAQTSGTVLPQSASITN